MASVAARALRRARLGLRTESARAVVSVLVGVVPAVALGDRSLQDLPLGSLDPRALVVFGALAVYQVAYVVLTAAVLAGVRGEELVDAGRTMPPSRSWWRALDGSQPGAGVAVGLAVTALVVAGYLLPQALRIQDAAVVAGVVVLGGVLVVSAWAAMVTTFAVDYLRRDVHARGLAFPGGGARGRAWSDYVYLAVSVSTSFGASDVGVTSRRMRRAVTRNAVTAFAFNAVIITLSVAAVATLAG